MRKRNQLSTADNQTLNFFKSLISTIREEYLCSTHYVKSEFFDNEGEYTSAIMRPKAHGNPAYSEFARQADLIKDIVHQNLQINLMVRAGALLRFGVGECGDFNMELLRRFCLAKDKPNGKVYLVMISTEHNSLINHGFSVYVPQDQLPKVESILRQIKSYDTVSFLSALPESALMIDPWRNACVFFNKENLNQLIDIFQINPSLTRLMAVAKGVDELHNVAWFDEEAFKLYIQVKALLIKNHSMHFPYRNSESTTLTKDLEAISGLSFTAKSNEEHYVDAVALINSPEDEVKARTLRERLGASARFEQTQKARFFIVPRINDEGTRCANGEVLADVISTLRRS